MAIQKKSLISALKTAKKANIASAKPPAAEDITTEVVNAQNLKSMRKSMRRVAAKKSFRSLKAAK
jgi:hypothetical protein